MSNTQNAEIYVYDSICLVLWEHGGKLVKRLSLWVNGQILPRPYIGTPISDTVTALLALDNGALTDRSVSFAITDDAGTDIYSSGDKCIRPLEGLREQLAASAYEKLLNQVLRYAPGKLSGWTDWMTTVLVGMHQSGAQWALAQETPVADLTGALERLENGKLVGWALDPARPFRTLEIDAYRDDLKIAMIEANRFRPELKWEKSDSGRHGFELDIPGEPVGQSFCRFSLCYSGTKIDVPGSPCRLVGDKLVHEQFDAADEERAFNAQQCPNRDLVGGIESVQAFQVKGWAVDRSDPHKPLVLQLEVDDIPVARIPTTEVRDGLKVPNIDCYQVFDLTLPAESLLPPWREIFRLTIREMDSGLPLIFGYPLRARPGISDGPVTRPATPDQQCLERALTEAGLDIALLPTAWDADSYLRLNADLAPTIRTRNAAAIHYLRHGRAEGRTFQLDSNFYRAYYKANSDIASDREALSHYARQGRKEGAYATPAACVEALGLTPERLRIDLTAEDLHQLNPDTPYETPAQAIAALLLQEPPAVIRIFDESSKNCEMYTALGIAFEKKGLFDKAVQTYQIALLFDDQPIPNENLGNIHFRNQHFHLAIHYYRRSCAHSHASFWASQNLADVLLHVGQPQAAIEVLLAGASAHPEISNFGAKLDVAINSFWSLFEKEMSVLAANQDRRELVERTNKAVETVSAAYRASFLKLSIRPPRVLLESKRVLIVGDFFLPQCIRYRIEQKQEQFAYAGYEVESIPWTEAARAAQAICWNDYVIFYRVPALPSIVRLIEMARSLGKLTFFEIDDLVFEPIYPPPIATYGGAVGPAEYLDLTKSAALFRSAARLCDFAIASTKPLLSRLAPLVRYKKGFLHRNALDRHNRFALREHGNEGAINLFYGSFTRAHNSDFVLEVLPAIQRILAENDHVFLILVGYLELPASFLLRFAKRIKKVPAIHDIEQYWLYLENADINMAVLHEDPINDTKSELKWFEAACFGLPSVVSRTRNYLDVVRHGKDGYIVKGEDQWYQTLSALIGNPALREAIGTRAFERIQAEYSVPVMARNLSSIFDTAREEFLASADPGSAGPASPKRARRIAHVA